MIQEHGGDIYRYGDILDFSANLSPLGTPESVKRAVMESAEFCGAYPDPMCRRLRERLSEYEGIPPENIVCGNGADDLIYRAVHVFRPARAVIAVPCFGEYEKALAEVNCRAVRHYLRAEDDFLLGGDIMEKLTSDTDMLILCTPNNPTGQLIPAELMRELSEVCLKKQIIFICDECFLGFAEKGEDYSLKRHMSGYTVVLRAFTKLYAMAGLRLGYALCGSPELADRLSRSGQYWSVSTPAQAAGIAALSEEEYVRETVRTVSAEREYLSGELKKMGLRVYPSASDYLLFRAGAGLAERLLEEGILIRDCGNYAGLDDSYYRIAVWLHEENVRLTEALRRCISG